MCSKRERGGERERHEKERETEREEEKKEACLYTYSTNNTVWGTKLSTTQKMGVCG